MRPTPRRVPAPKLGPKAKSFAFGSSSAESKFVSSRTYLSGNTFFLLVRAVAFLPRVNVELEADVESAYQAHSAIMDRRPFSAQYAAMTVDFDAFGYVGGYA